MRGRILMRFILSCLRVGSEVAFLSVTGVGRMEGRVVWVFVGVCRFMVGLWVDRIDVVVVGWPACGGILGELQDTLSKSNPNRV